MTETVKVRRLSTSTTSVGITIPARLAALLHLKDGDYVELTYKRTIGGPALVVYREKQKGGAK